MEGIKHRLNLCGKIKSQIVITLLVTLLQHELFAFVSKVLLLTLLI